MLSMFGGQISMAQTVMVRPVVSSIVRSGLKLVPISSSSSSPSSSPSSPSSSLTITRFMSTNIGDAGGGGNAKSATTTTTQNTTPISPAAAVAQVAKTPGKFVPRQRFIRGPLHDPATGKVTKARRGPNPLTGRRHADDMDHIDKRGLQVALKDADLDFFRIGGLPHPEWHPIDAPTRFDEAADLAYHKYLLEKKKRDRLLIAKYVIKSNITRTTRKAGKVDTFACLVIAGNRRGTAGWGYGKSKDRMEAQEKAFRNVWKNLLYVPRLEQRTFFYPSVGKYNGVICKLFPRSRFAGFTTGPLMSLVFDCFGIRDGTARMVGNRKSLRTQIYAAWNALAQQVSHADTAAARGKSIHTLYDRGVLAEKKPTLRQRAANSREVADILDRIRTAKRNDGDFSKIYNDDEQQHPQRGGRQQHGRH